MEPELIAGSVSPNGNIEAIAEQDDRCAYLYLHEIRQASLDVGFGTKPCWIRNLKPAPESLPSSDMQRGIAPMMPRACCAHPDGAVPLSSDAVRIVWFEEGDAAALVERESVLAIIPCWGGKKGFCGYARDCTAESILAWPLTEDSVLKDRVRAAEDYWKSWDIGDPWTAVREAGWNAVTAALGEPTNYYAIDGGAWPPQAMLRCAQGDAVVLVTCGMQLRPQPTVELYSEDPRPLRRIELGLAIERRLFERAPDRVMKWLSGQAKYPWHSLSWLGPGHTMSCDSIPVGSSGREFTGVLFQNDPIGAPRVAFPAFRDDPVSLLWLVPVTGLERELAQRNGSKEVARRLTANGHGFVHRDRLPVV